MNASKAFVVLAKLYNKQTEFYENREYGMEKSHYLLFDGLNKNLFYRLLREAYEKTDFLPKSAHCARHTFATNLAGLTNSDTGLNRLILGHKDEDTTLGYVHLFEQINRLARANDQLKNRITLLED